jgi:sulfur carrier protein
MNIIVNGEARQARSATLAELLVELGYDNAWIATAVNGEVVAGDRRAVTALAEGDRIEVLAPRQGG